MHRLASSFPASRTRRHRMPREAGSGDWVRISGAEVMVLARSDGIGDVSRLGLNSRRGIEGSLHINACCCECLCGNWEDRKISDLGFDIPDLLFSPDTHRLSQRREKKRKAPNPGRTGIQTQPRPHRNSNPTATTARLRPEVVADPDTIAIRAHSEHTISENPGEPSSFPSSRVGMPSRTLRVLWRARWTGPRTTRGPIGDAPRPVIRPAATERPLRDEGQPWSSSSASLRM